MAQTKKSLREVWNSIGGFTGLWREGREVGARMVSRLEDVGPEQFWQFHSVVLAGIVACSVANFCFEILDLQFLSGLGIPGFLGFMVGGFSIGWFYYLFALRSELYGDHKVPSQRRVLRFLLFAFIVGIGCWVVLILLHVPFVMLSSYNIVSIVFLWGLTALLSQLHDIFIIDYTAAMKPYFSFKRVRDLVLTFPIYGIAYLYRVIWGVLVALYVFFTRILGPILVAIITGFLLQKMLVTTGLVSLVAFGKMMRVMGFFVGGLYIYYVMLVFSKRVVPHTTGFLLVYYKHVGLISSGSDEKHLEEDGSNDCNSF